MPLVLFKSAATSNVAGIRRVREERVAVVDVLLRMSTHASLLVIGSHGTSSMRHATLGVLIHVVDIDAVGVDPSSHDGASRQTRTCSNLARIRRGVNTSGGQN